MGTVAFACAKLLENNYAYVPSFKTAKVCLRFESDVKRKCHRCAVLVITCSLQQQHTLLELIFFFL